MNDDVSDHVCNYFGLSYDANNDAKDYIGASDDANIYVGE
jgi:hypothetical protein